MLTALRWETLGSDCPKQPWRGGPRWRHWAPSNTRTPGRALGALAGAQPHPVLASHPGPPEEGPRVVFMVDLWHPNVAAAERQALDFIFAPGR